MSKQWAGRRHPIVSGSVLEKGRHGSSLHAAEW